MTRRASVIDLDPGLASGLPDEAVTDARATVSAEVIAIDRGRRWNAFDPLEATDRLGLLVVGGVLACRVRPAGRETVDLFASGDLIRPWAPLDEYDELFTETRWQVLQPVQLAVLDRRFLLEAARWPELQIALSERTAQHARSLALRLAINQIPQVASRVQVMLWHLADRFGRVDRDGVLVPLRLSHVLIAGLVGARREVVGRNLKLLEERGVVVPDGRGWRLHDAPPAELAAVSPGV